MANPKGRRRGRTPKNKTHPVTIERAERVRRILQYRVDGWTLEEIAAVEKIGKSRVHKIISDALANMVFEPTKQIVNLEMARLDQMFIKQFEAAVNGNSSAIDKCLAIMNRRASYLGLDAPEKFEEVGAAVEAKASLLNKLAGMAERFAGAAQAENEAK